MAEFDELLSLIRGINNKLKLKALAHEIYHSRVFTPKDKGILLGKILEFVEEGRD